MAKHTRIMIASAIILNAAALAVLFWLVLDSGTHTERKPDTVRVGTAFGDFRDVSPAEATARAGRRLSDMQSEINNLRADATSQARNAPFGR